MLKSVTSVNSACILSSLKDEQQLHDQETHLINCLTQAGQAPRPEELKSFLSWGESVKQEKKNVRHLVSSREPHTRDNVAYLTYEGDHQRVVSARRSFTCDVKQSRVMFVDSDPVSLTDLLSRTQTLFDHLTSS